MSKRERFMNALAWAWIFFTIAALVTLAVALDAEADANKEFTVRECKARCEPLPVIMYLPGYCHIENDRYNVQKCAGPSNTQYAQPIGDVCVCGQQSE